MVFSKRFRTQLSEVDARWKTKTVFRMIMNVMCLLSSGCALYTLLKTSKFQPNGFEQARAVLVYVPCDGISVAWNLINTLHLFFRKRAFSQVTNILVHFSLGVGFMVVGIYVTIVAWAAHTHLGQDLYGIEALGTHNLVAANGQTITVDQSNVASCPAFDSCDDQDKWLRDANIRGIISITGSIIFDSVFLLHVVFFFWSCNDAIFGVRGTTARIEAREERDRIRKWQDDHPIPETSASNKSFDITAKPSEEMLAKAGLRNLPERDPDRGGKSFISGPVVTEHTAYTLDESGEDFTPTTTRTFILRPSTGSRESLSLSIFESTPSSLRLVSGLPTTPSVLTLPHSIPEEGDYDASLLMLPTSSVHTPTSISSSSSNPPPSALNSRKSSRALAKQANYKSNQSSSSRPASTNGTIQSLQHQRQSKSSSGYNQLQDSPERSSQAQLRSRESEHLSSSTFMTAPTDSFSRNNSATNLDFTQQPHPEYSYYRGSSNSRRTSAIPLNQRTSGRYQPDTQSPPILPMPKTYSSGDLGYQEYEMAEKQRSDNVTTSVRDASRDSFHSKRESISALPPIPKKQDSTETVKSTKSVKSTRSTKPKKLQRKSTLKNGTNTSETNQ